MYDPGFTKAEPYSYRFEWFGFGSTNYVLAIGTTINVLIAMILIKSIIAFLIKQIVQKQEVWFVYQNLAPNINSTMHKAKWIRKELYPTQVKHKWITFFLETYVELLISAVVAF